MKEQFEMKLPKRSETSDFVKEQEKITCPRGHGTRSEAEGSQPLRTALRLPGLLGWKSSLKASLYCRKLAGVLYCIITSFMQNFYLCLCLRICCCSVILHTKIKVKYMNKTDLHLQT